LSCIELLGLLPKVGVVLVGGAFRIGEDTAGFFKLLIRQ
jgi:hypothetical protein